MLLKVAVIVALPMIVAFVAVFGRFAASPKHEVKPVEESWFDLSAVTKQMLKDESRRRKQHLLSRNRYSLIGYKG